MALREKYMIRTYEGVSEARLKANVGESILVKGVYVSPVAGDFAIFYIDKTTVGYFRIDPELGNHLDFPVAYDYGAVNLLDWLRGKGVFNGYPVGEGETFIIRTLNGNTFTATILYELYDAGDQTPEAENGSKSDSYLLVNYGQPSAAPTGPGDVLIDKSLNPAEFPAFPFGFSVPANTEIDLIAIAGRATGRTSGTGANKAITKYLKLTRERVVLFDEDKNGLLFMGYTPANDGVARDGAWSVIGDATTVNRKEPYFFDEPLTFRAGEELNVYITTEVLAGTQNLTASDLQIAFIEKVRRAG